MSDLNLSAAEANRRLRVAARIKWVLEDKLDGLGTCPCYSGEDPDECICSFQADLAAAIAALSVDPLVCHWWLSEKECNCWSSACGREWQFTDDGPTENDVRFCSNCGKPVTVDEEEPCE